MRSILTTVTGTLVAAALVGTCLGGAAEPAAAAPTPTPTSSPAPQGATPAPTPTAAPEADAAAPDAAAPDAAVGAGLADDPSLAEMNAAQNHTMGSTIPTNDPQAKKDEAAREAAASTSSKREATTQSDDGASTQAQAQAAAVPPGVPGLDVSGWQENVDWNAVWAQGARFAYVKSTEGLTYRSGQFAQQYAGSYNVGMVRGAYHFARPDVSSGTAQADYFVANGGGWVGDSRTLPPLLDIEYNPYGETCYGMAGAAMVSWIAEFSARVKALTGARPAIYTTTDWWSRCTANSPAFGLNPLFIARYPANLASGAGTLPASWGSYTFWQYSSTGPFPGDSDVFNGSEATLRQLALTGLPMQQPVAGAGDLNGDGRPDLVARRPDGSLWFYAGAGVAGQGVGFVAGRQIGTGWGLFNQIVGAGDANGDGKADILARKSDGQLVFYAGNGTGLGFASGVQVGTGWDVFTDIVPAGDVDGDGTQDLFARRPDGALFLYTSRVQGSAPAYRTGQLVGSSWNIFTTVVPAGDVDDDGKPDVVGQRPDGSVWLYRGAGTSFSSGVRMPTPGVSATDQVVSAGDANGDGIPDLYTKGRDGTLAFIAGTSVPSAAYGSGQRVGSGWQSFRSVVPAGDITGDSVPDVLAVTTDGSLLMYAGAGISGSVNRSYLAGVRVGWGWQDFLTVTDAGDVTGDGRRDLLAAKKDGSLWVYPGTNGAGGSYFGLPTRLASSGWKDFTSLLVTDDLDGDGTRDIVATRVDGTSTFTPGVARPAGSAFALGRSVEIGRVQGGATIVSGRDVDGDSVADLVVTRTDGILAFVPGRGSVAGAQSVFTRSATTIGSGWQIFDRVRSTGDVTGARSGDLLATTPDGSLLYYPATGQAGRTQPSYAPRVVVGSSWNIFG